MLTAPRHSDKKENGDASVVVSWKGSCPNRAEREQLVAALTLERLGRPEEALDRLLTGVERSREWREGRAVVSGVPS